MTPLFAAIWKTVPVAVLIGAVAFQSLVNYVGAISLLCGILFAGTVWSAARSYKEQADARKAENELLKEQAATRETETDERDRQRAQEITLLKAEVGLLKAQVEELRLRPDLTTIAAQMSQHHSETLAKLQDIAQALNR